MTQVPTFPSDKPSLPAAFDGQIYEQVGKYARQAVLFAFEQLDGPQGLAKWAKDNQNDFYTKLFPKIIAKESEVKHTRDIDALMDVIDGEYEVHDDVPDAEVMMPVDGGYDATSDPMDLVRVNVDQDYEFDVDEMVEFDDG